MLQWSRGCSREDGTKREEECAEGQEERKLGEGERVASGNDKRGRETLSAMKR